MPEPDARARPGLLVVISGPSGAGKTTIARARGRDDEDEIARRFAQAKSEMAEARACGAYDAFVVNDDLDRAIEEAVVIVGRRRR